MTDMPLGLKIRILRHQGVSYEAIGHQLGIDGAKARGIRLDYDHREKWGQPCYTPCPCRVRQVSPPTRA